MIVFADNKTIDELEEYVKNGYILASCCVTTTHFLKNNLSIDNILRVINEITEEIPDEPYVGVHCNIGDDKCVERLENIIM